MSGGDSRRAAGSQAGFTSIELLLGVAMVGLAIAATSGMFLAGKGHMVMKAREIETTQAARAALDMLVRDLRLGGACLPVTGEFIALEGIDNGEHDEITTRTGMTRPDLSCIRSASTQMTTESDVLLHVESSDGFYPGMSAYIRHPDGSGEYFAVAAVPAPTLLIMSGPPQRSYPPTSGVYAIDQRRFFISWVERKAGMVPQLMVQVGVTEPSPFATGIEELQVRYQLRANCNPDCDVVDLPSNNSEWQTVEQVLLNLTARSELPGPDGDYFRRTVQVGVKPRNLLPR